MERTTVLAICGSLRQDSLHRALLTAVETRSPQLRLVGADLVRDFAVLAGFVVVSLGLAALSLRRATD